ncbi:hypothetical protein GVN23_08510 [Sphingobium yanoikuyae]|jgi:hypothetical protein|nr:hypothetical protein [Sphingobium yanoikuyae]
MYDLRTYMATKDLPGGPFFVPEEQLTPPALLESAEDRPLTLGRVIGGLVSLGLLIATGAYLYLAI